MSTLNMLFSLLNPISVPKKGQLTLYSDVVDYLLLTYASDDIIAEREAELQKFRQRPRLSEKEHTTALKLKAMSCGAVYNETSLIEILIEGLHEEISDTVSLYWAVHPDADLNELTRYAESVMSLK